MHEEKPGLLLLYPLNFRWSQTELQERFFARSVTFPCTSVSLACACLRVFLYSMSRWWKENQWSEQWIEPWCWQSEGGREEVPGEDEAMFEQLTLTEPAERIVLKERNPWLTPA